MATAADMSASSIEDIAVMFDVRHDGGVIVTSTFEPVAVKWFLQGSKLAVEKKVVKEDTGPKDAAYEALLDAMPWLLHLDETDGVCASGGEDQQEGRWQ